MNQILPRSSSSKCSRSSTNDAVDANDDVACVGDDDSAFFRTLHGRKLNSMNNRYMLPADEDELKVCGCSLSGLGAELTGWRLEVRLASPHGAVRLWREELCRKCVSNNRS